MRTIETTAVVTPEHTITVNVPEDIPPGDVRVVVVVENSRPQPTPGPSLTANWNIVDLGPWPEGFTASREELYGDDGR
jgi:hypothetical protein